MNISHGTPPIKAYNKSQTNRKFSAVTRPILFPSPMAKNIHRRGKSIWQQSVRDARIGVCVNPSIESSSSSRSDMQITRRLTTSFPARFASQSMPNSANSIGYGNRSLVPSTKLIYFDSIRNRGRLFLCYFITCGYSGSPCVYPDGAK